MNYSRINSDSNAKLQTTPQDDDNLLSQAIKKKEDFADISYTSSTFYTPYSNPSNITFHDPSAGPFLGPSAIPFSGPDISKEFAGVRTDMPISRNNVVKKPENKLYNKIINNIQKVVTSKCQKNPIDQKYICNHSTHVISITILSILLIVAVVYIIKHDKTR
jgi:hypothetical protein